MKISLVAAMADNRVIGRRGRLPWRIPADMKHFKRITMGKPVIMGRKTYQSIGVALPGRFNIVVTTRPGLGDADVETARSVHQALDLAEKHGREAMIIGGGEIYQATLPLADYIYLTEVHSEPEGDVHFPPLDKTLWREVRREHHEAKGKVPAFSFVELERI